MSAELKPLVQKYGGTSVGSVEKIQGVAKRVARLWRGGEHIAVVVSAMSGETNRLVGLVKEVNPDANPRNYDMAVAAGEQVSVALMAAALEAEGVGSKAFLAYQLGIFTDESHSRARIESIDCQKLFRCWEQGYVPVIAGFQGVTKDFEITTLGRGGSDTSAVALAVALGAHSCEINTDVDGVFTADPRIVPHAKRVDCLDFEMALEMASLGSKVLHNRCVELGAKYKMPLFVRSTFNSQDNLGTKIMNFSAKEKLEAPVVSGVTLDRDVVQLALRGLATNHEAVSQVFNLIAEKGVNVDIIVHNRKAEEGAGQDLGFTIGGQDLTRAVGILEGLNGSSATGDFQIEVREKLAKVSVVGLGMISHPGVASQVFSTLAQENIDVHMISTSEIKISCVISAEHAEAAVKVLHKVFIESEG